MNERRPRPPYPLGWFYPVDGRTTPPEADAGAGERRIGDCQRHDAEEMGLGSSARCTCPPRTATPAEPDAGNVEGFKTHVVATLASSLYRRTDLNLPLADSLDIDCHDVARALLTSDWLATHDAALLDQQRRKVAERTLLDTAANVLAGATVGNETYTARQVADYLTTRARLARGEGR